MELEKIRFPNSDTFIKLKFKFWNFSVDFSISSHRWLSFCKCKQKHFYAFNCIFTKRIALIMCALTYN